MTKILVAIPCYNCKKEIIKVLDGFDRNLLEHITDVLVVDNNSSDGTAESVKGYFIKNRRPFHLFINNENYGLGGSFQIIMKWARENHYDWVCTIHGDAQGNTQDLNLFLNIINSDESYDALLGSRFMRESHLINYSRIREWGNRFFNVLYSILTRRRIYDVGSGINAFKVSAVPDELVKKLTSHLTFDAELLLHLIRRKKNIRFIPITWKDEGQISNAHNFDVGLRLLSLIIRWMTGIKLKAPTYAGIKRTYQEFKIQ